jgi:hypothetical protein
MRIKKIVTNRLTTRPTTRATPWSAAIADAHDHALRLCARTHMHL